MALRHLKPQEPELRCRGLGQLCLAKFAAAQQQGWDIGFPKAPSAPTGGMHSHLQLSKEAPTTCPGLSVPPQQDWGSDTLAPCKQQDTDTRGEQKPARQGEISLCHMDPCCHSSKFLSCAAQDGENVPCTLLP